MVITILIHLNDLREWTLCSASGVGYDIIVAWYAELNTGPNDLLYTSIHCSHGTVALDI